MVGVVGVVAFFALGGCVTVPKGIQPVAPFDLEAYLGRWYEIARLDHSFERGLEEVRAEYSLREDGKIRVLNQGYAAGEGRWKKIEGVAEPVRGADEGFLQVSFFGPFYAAYCVFELGPEGDYAFVCGANRSYLWLLAREPEVSPAVRERFLNRAAELGFDTSGLVWVEQTGLSPGAPGP